MQPFHQQHHQLLLIQTLPASGNILLNTSPSRLRKRTHLRIHRSKHLPSCSIRLGPLLSLTLHPCKLSGKSLLLPRTDRIITNTSGGTCRYADSAVSNRSSTFPPCCRTASYSRGFTRIDVVLLRPSFTYRFCLGISASLLSIF